MRAQTLALAAAATLALPAAALAQNNRNFEAELRAREAQQNLRNYQIEQRQNEIDTRTTDLDLRLRTQQNLNALGSATPTYQPTDNQPVRTELFVIDDKLQHDMAAAELSAQNERLRARNPR